MSIVDCLNPFGLYVSLQVGMWGNDVSVHGQGNDLRDFIRSQPSMGDATTLVQDADDPLLQNAQLDAIDGGQHDPKARDTSGNWLLFSIVSVCHFVIACCSYLLWLKN